MAPAVAKTISSSVGATRFEPPNSADLKLLIFIYLTDPSPFLGLHRHAGQPGSRAEDRAWAQGEGDPTKCCQRVPVSAMPGLRSQGRKTLHNTRGGRGRCQHRLGDPFCHWVGLRIRAPENRCDRTATGLTRPIEGPYDEAPFSVSRGGSRRSFMARRGWHRIGMLLVAGLIVGCNGSDEGPGQRIPVRQSRADPVASRSSASTAASR